MLFAATARAFCEIDSIALGGHAVWGAGAGAVFSGCYLGSMLVYFFSFLRALVVSRVGQRSEGLPGA